MTMTLFLTSLVDVLHPVLPDLQEVTTRTVEGSLVPTCMLASGSVVVPTAMNLPLHRDIEEKLVLGRFHAFVSERLLARNRGWLFKSIARKPESPAAVTPVIGAPAREPLEDVLRAAQPWWPTSLSYRTLKKETRTWDAPRGIYVHAWEARTDEPCMQLALWSRPASRLTEAEKLQVRDDRALAVKRLLELQHVANSKSRTIWVWPPGVSVDDVFQRRFSNLVLSSSDSRSGGSGSVPPKRGGWRVLYSL